MPMRLGMLAVSADATRDETLRDLHIDRARGLVAALSSDADNMFLILSAKSLNSKLLVSARANEEESEEKLRRAGDNGDSHGPRTIASPRTRRLTGSITVVR